MTIWAAFPPYEGADLAAANLRSLLLQVQSAGVNVQLDDRLSLAEIDAAPEPHPQPGVIHDFLHGAPDVPEATHAAAAASMGN